MSVKIKNALPPIPNPFDIQERLNTETWGRDHGLRFVEEYNRMSRSPGIMQLFAMVFPIQLFLLGRWAMGIVFMGIGPFAFAVGSLIYADTRVGSTAETVGIAIITGAMLVGGAWYIVEMFQTQRRVREYNQALAEGLFQRFDHIIQKDINR